MIKNKIKSIIGTNGTLYKILSKYYRRFSDLMYKIKNFRKIFKEKKHYSNVVNFAIKELNQFKNKKYIVFYNPTWLGVAASTQGLFKYNVGLEHIYKKSDIKKLSKSIVSSNIKTVIFSQVCDGWIDLIKMIKSYNDNILVKVIWHGNCYEFFSDFTWNLNSLTVDLCREGIIDALGFVRTTMYELYKNVGINSFYLQNNVFKKNAGKTSKCKNGKNIKIGIYNADSRELKNIYTSLSAIRMINNGIADVVPINAGAKEFAKIIGLTLCCLDNYISNDELMNRISKNDINIYPTFTENAPMFPLESFEMGVPCLLGNNNDYFIGTKLGDYVILEKEDDPLYIKERILYVYNNKEIVMQLYRDWKKSFNKKCEELVNLFVE